MRIIPDARSYSMDSPTHGRRRLRANDSHHLLIRPRHFVRTIAVLLVLAVPITGERLAEPLVVHSFVVDGKSVATNGSDFGSLLARIRPLGGCTGGGGPCP